ncbi:MAG TPA: Rv2578c family radical SAM protein [Microbacterium sp.]|uniref:Rv2578c family radical SAM protein n=1 Tax=Microbacterium sp. TaxID=51671 RepID=UPI002B496D00|nr:Rv2578c family radical SAM protein [Microbacterium sp.]HKT55618.1 Rv2578c family radical SAM protein [Microbacterium sp.]
MRWNGQELGTANADALPGLEHLSGLVRSVTTPEFAGMTFHEVLARSALNHVPQTSAMPFAWTVNPYRGCSHACAYCLSPDTMVLAADGRHRPIGSLMPGDEIIGTVREGRYRRYVRTRVLARWSTRKPAYRVTLADGTELIASGDHRFLTQRGWKHVTGAMCGTDQRPYLTTNDRLLGFGHVPASPDEVSEPFRRGYLTGVIDGTAVKSVADLRVVSIEPLGTTIDMVDITTGTGDFLANGVISHNCFARGTHEYLDLDAGHDFDSQIVVKVNVADVLRRELSRGSWQHEHVALGTNTDPYQRAEGRYRLMPGIISALTDSGTPFSILTKGTLLRRDLPLLQDAASSVDVSLAMSIAVFDEALQHSIEPGTPTAHARLDTVRAATDAGFAVTVFLMPILPHLTDTIPAIDDALRRIRDAGARRVIFGALHLRPGVKPWFQQWLAREHPELVSSYRALYPGAAVQAPKAYRAWLAKRVRPLVRRYGLDGRLEEEQPRFGPSRPGPVIRTGRPPAADAATRLF